MDRPSSPDLSRGADADFRLIASRLFTGTANRTALDQVVTVRDGRIVDIGPVPARIHANPELPLLEYPGATVMPGLIDAHAHLSLAGDSRSYEQMVPDTDDRMVAIGLDNCRRHLRAGVTTVRDHGARRQVIFSIRDAVSLGLSGSPRIVASGPPLTQRGGHFSWCEGTADSDEEIVRRVHDLSLHKADHIKIMATGGGTVGTDPRLPSYEVPQLQTAIAAAHERGLLTTAHCLNTEGIRRAVEAGIDCIEHVRFLDADGKIRFDPALGDEIASAGIYLSPTLQAFGHLKLPALREREREGHLTPEDRSSLDRISTHLAGHLDTVTSLLRLGLHDRLLFGTDAGCTLIPFGDVVSGMQFMIAAGMTPPEALRSATAWPADALGLDDIGILAEGKLADMIIVDGRPDETISDIGRVSAVFQAGHLTHSL